MNNFKSCTKHVAEHVLNIFKRFCRDTPRYFESSIFREAHISTIEIRFQRAHYSDTPIFRHLNIPTHINPTATYTDTFSICVLTAAYM